MGVKSYVSRRAIRVATALALLAVTGLVVAALLMEGAGGARAFNTGASDDVARHMPIPAQFTGQCSNGVAVANPGDNAGLVGDCAALLAAKDGLEGGGDRAIRLDWSADRAIGDWRGVSVSDGRVAALSLSNGPGHTGDWLTGAIPAELGNLDKLTSLGFNNNGLTGEIPAELGKLDNLRELSLYENELTSEIPAELGGLANLRTLWISNNRLTGAIPAELGDLANLRKLVLNGNQLTGEIPAELGNLANLEWLYLSDNRLTGEMPAWLGNLARLDLLSLSNNRLTGEIPAELGRLANLTYVFLHGNQLTGCVPESLRAHMTPWELQRIELPFCAGAAGATPTATATSVASDDVMGRLAALERQVAEIPELRRQVAEIPGLKERVVVLGARVARLEGGSGAGAATPTPSATPVSVIEGTPSPTPTWVAATSGGDACVTELSGSGRISVSGRWTSDCLTANAPNNRTYYARFYTFRLLTTLDATITLASSDAAPYLYLLEGEGTGGEVKQHKGAADATSVTITESSLQPGDYTIEATTWSSETAGDFTLEIEVTFP